MDTPQRIDRAQRRILAGPMASGMDDAEIVARICRGERWAEDVLFRRHVRSIHGTAVRLLGNHADAEDVVQTTFVTALARISTLRDPAALSGWLTQIAVRSVYRTFRRRKLLRLLGLDRGFEDAALDVLASPDASPELRAELALLNGKLAMLPAAERLAWMLRHVEGQSLPEVARSAGCSLATAKRRIAAAKHKLGVQLAEVSDD